MDTTAPNSSHTPSVRYKNVAKWLAAIVAPVIFVILLDALLGPVSRIETGWQMDRAQVIEAQTDNAKLLPTSGWKSMPLADRFEATRNPASLWYRFELNVTEPGDAVWAVYIVSPYANVSAFVNGHAIGDGGPMRMPLPMYRTPLLFEFSSGLLRRGENTVLVHCMVEAYTCALPAIHIGPRVAVEPAYGFVKLMALTVKQISVISLYAMSMVMAALFLMRRRDTAFGWFALGLGCWATHISIMLVSRAPLGLHLWANLNGIALGAFVVCSVFFVNRFVGQRAPLAERVCVGWWILTTAVLLIDPIFFGYQLPKFAIYVWMPGVQLIGAFSIWQLIRANHRQPEPELRWLALASWFVLAVGIRDGGVDAGPLRPQPLYLTYTVGIVLFVFGLIMLRRFVRALDVAEMARVELELRVAQKSAELETNLVRIKDMERDQALSVERDRIMRDMHDGVGGQLVQALAVAATDPKLSVMELPLRNSLDELRLMIDSLEPVEGDLASVLGTLRVRLKHKLTAAGIKVEWRVEDIPPLPNFGPHKVLQVSRIVHEAIANVLKHAHACTIVLSARIKSSEGRTSIEISVGDNGRGMQTTDHVGRGLSNMRRRAADLGGDLSVTSGSQGTLVALLIPVSHT